MLKLTTDRHETSRGLFATAEHLILCSFNFCLNTLVEVTDFNLSSREYHKWLLLYLIDRCPKDVENNPR